MRKATPPSRERAGEALQFEALRPERRRRRAMVAPCCCSCCCCCLHTLGGLAGAASASPVPQDAKKEAARFAVKAYWTLLFLVLAGVVTACSLGQVDSTVAVWFLALALPAVQVGISLLALVVVALYPLEDKAAAVKTIGSITYRSFMGALLGLLGLGGILLVIMLLA